MHAGDEADASRWVRRVMSDGMQRYLPPSQSCLPQETMHACLPKPYPTLSAAMLWRSHSCAQGDDRHVLAASHQRSVAATP